MTYHYIVPRSVAEMLTDDEISNFEILSDYLQKVALDPLEHVNIYDKPYFEYLPDDTLIVNEYGKTIRWKEYKKCIGYVVETNSLPEADLALGGSDCQKMSFRLSSAKRVLFLARLARQFVRHTKRNEKRFYWCKECSAFHLTSKIKRKPRLKQK
jgi:hypothetical protein